MGLATFESTSLFTLCRGLLDVHVQGVSCGNGHTAVVTQCGTVFTFGQNEAHQLGHSSDLTEAPVPREVQIPERIVSVSAGGAFTLALSEDGALYGAATSLSVTACGTQATIVSRWMPWTSSELRPVETGALLQAGATIALARLVPGTGPTQCSTLGGSRTSPVLSPWQQGPTMPSLFLKMVKFSSGVPMVQVSWDSNKQASRMAHLPSSNAEPCQLTTPCSCRFH